MKTTPSYPAQGALRRNFEWDSTGFAMHKGEITLLIEQLSADLRAVSGGVVETGPLRGLKLTGENIWSASDEPARLIGCYEAELHKALEIEIARQPDLVLNIGCGEGYYAVGLARCLPRARILAYDRVAAAQLATRRTAELNGVEDRIETKGTCDSTELARALEGAPTALIVADCEGCEADLFKLDPTEFLANTALIIECHEFRIRGVTKTLAEQFERTHEVVRINEGARDPNAYPLLVGRHSIIRWLAVCEHRPEMMNWLWCRPRATMHGTTHDGVRMATVKL